MKRFFLALALVALSVPAAADPLCDGEFHWVDVPGTRCLDGSPTGHYYRCLPGNDARSPLLLMADGGGGCWDGVTCDCRPDENGQCQDYGVRATISMKWRPAPAYPAPKWAADGIAIVAGCVLFLFLAKLFHPYVVGLQVLPA